MEKPSPPFRAACCQPVRIPFSFHFFLFPDLFVGIFPIFYRFIIHIKWFDLFKKKRNILTNWWFICVLWEFAQPIFPFSLLLPLIRFLRHTFFDLIRFRAHKNWQTEQYRAFHWITTLTHNNRMLMKCHWLWFIWIREPNKFTSVTFIDVLC